jgi:hypothetical protein
MSSTSYRLRSSLGQSSSIGGMSSASYRLNSGYWTAAPQLPTTTQVTPGQGGALTSPSGKVLVAFRAGAVNGPTTVTFTPLFELNRPSSADLDSLSASASEAGDRAFAADASFVGTAFRLDAVDAGGDPVTTFNLPFTITLHYDEADWQGAGVTDEATLNLAYWDEGGAAWVDLLPCAGCSLDTTNNQLVAAFDRTAEFGLFGEGERRIYLPLAIKGAP